MPDNATPEGMTDRDTRARLVEQADEEAEPMHSDAYKALRRRYYIGRWRIVHMRGNYVRRYGVHRHFSGYWSIVTRHHLVTILRRSKGATRG